MAYSLQYSSKSIKALDEITDIKVRTRIIAVIENLLEAPKQGKLLGGVARKKGIRSLRITTSHGEFRVLYRIIEREIIIILFVATREEVYKILERSI